MPHSRRDFLRHAAAGLTLPLLHPGDLLRALAARTADPFQPTWDSLAGYKTPEWFRDAKFGLWAHWGPQCQPERGDWYARRMYIQGDKAYEHHVATYGHPSRTGFMDVIHRWTAERWDPEELLTLYKRAGAKYFVGMANHHDNFDMYDSKHHAWNSVRVGPKKDIIGTWARIARAKGMRFGVTNHSAHAWHWYQTAYGYDAEGPLAGVRYDAARLTKADGAGTWWDGLDPQQLYTGPRIVLPDGISTAKAALEWHNQNDRKWDEAPPPGDPAYGQHWLLRCQDLLEKYRPDLLYFDDTELPLGQTGLDIAAWYYNANMKWNGGRLEAVLTAKKLAPEHRHALVEDYERGFSEELQPLPWQTDTCIGNWHYDRDVFEKHAYKSANTVVRMLVDIVSKNGNLLLNIPVRGEGTIDSDERAVVEDIATWMAVNGDAIFGTRPWTIFGEGPTKVTGGMFKERQVTPFTSQDVRFTTRGNTLYAMLLARPDSRTITIKSLATGSRYAPGEVLRVEMLGMPGPLTHTRGDDGLTIELPSGDRSGPVSVTTLSVTGRGIVTR
ncbi:MAG: alpha-L-fucosidase [Gemmatimonadaceae bacterium]